MTVAEIFDHVERKFNVREKQEAQQRYPQRRPREETWQREIKEISNVNEEGEPPKGGDAGANKTRRTNKTRGRSATRAASPPPTLPVPQLAPPPSPPPPLPKPQDTPQVPIPQGNGWGKGFVPQENVWGKGFGKNNFSGQQFQNFGKGGKGNGKGNFSGNFGKGNGPFMGRGKGAPSNATNPSQGGKGGVPPASQE
jgi:hypothetical protein